MYGIVFAHWAGSGRGWIRLDWIRLDWDWGLQDGEMRDFSKMVMVRLVVVWGWGGMGLGCTGVRMDGAFSRIFKRLLMLVSSRGSSGLEFIAFFPPHRACSVFPFSGGVGGFSGMLLGCWVFWDATCFAGSGAGRCTGCGFCVCFFSLWGRNPSGWWVVLGLFFWFLSVESFEGGVVVW